MSEAHGMARSFGTIKAIVRMVGMPSIPRYYRRLFNDEKCDGESLELLYRAK